MLVDTAPVALAAETSIVTLGRRRRDRRGRRARPAPRRAGGHAATSSIARARNVLGIVLNRTEVAEDRTLKSAYGRPYRTARASRADEGEPIAADAVEPELGVRSVPPPRSTARR